MTGVPLQPSGAMALRVSASMMTMVFVSLLVRVWARFKAPARFLSLDDFLVVAAAAVYYVEQGLFLNAVMGNGASGGSDISFMTVPQLDRFSMYLYAEEILFVVSITLVKLSILVFYRRIFSIGYFIPLTTVVLAACVIWAVICIFFVIFQCSPIHAQWNVLMQLEQQAKCFNSSTLIFGFEISNVSIDLLLLALPVTQVMQLQLRTAKKASITAVFLMGIFVCGACAVRAWYVWNPKTGESRSSSASLDWTTVEVATAILCASLPTYTPIFTKGSFISTVTSLCHSWLGTVRSWDLRSIHSGPSKPAATSSSSEYDQLIDGPDSCYKQATTVVAVRPATRQGNETYEMHGVRVQQSFEVA